MWRYLYCHQSGNLLAPLPPIWESQLGGHHARPLRGCSSVTPWGCSSWTGCPPWLTQAAHHIYHSKFPLRPALHPGMGSTHTEDPGCALGVPLLPPSCLLSEQSHVEKSALNSPPLPYVSKHTLRVVPLFRSFVICWVSAATTPVICTSALARMGILQPG